MGNDKKVMLDGNTYSHDLSKIGASFIRDNAKKPFFPYLPITIPTPPWSVPRRMSPRFEKSFLNLRTNWKYSHGTKVRNPVAAFAGMMTRMDRGVGQVLDLLDELKMQKTLVLFTSDNGHTMKGTPTRILQQQRTAERPQTRPVQRWHPGPLIAYWPEE
ncbi:MAG: hypothetical protein CM1200mP29_14570 [Verrucomicrobiota bacterium]|nr:MAG: hypothetical protein CM1200mP29_14570 [Verrucomicrobiota bacterium]